MKTTLSFIFPIVLLVAMTSCMSDTQKANEVIADAIRMSEASRDTAGVHNGKLASQTSEYGSHA